MSKMNKLPVGYKLLFKDSAYSHIELRGLTNRGGLKIEEKRKAVFTSYSFDDFNALFVHLVGTLSKLELVPGVVDMYNLRYNPGLLKSAIGTAAIFCTKVAEGSKVRTKLIIDECGLSIRLNLK